MLTKTFPKYFLIDCEIYVKVYFEKNTLLAVNDLGSPYQPYRAMGDGQEVTEAEFKEGAVKRRQKYP